MLLYNSMVSGNCYKVRLLLAHLGIEYERRELDVVDRSNRPEVLGGLNPDLRVPTLVLDDGRPLAESGAILWYFGERTRFVPDDRYERAKVLQWMFFEQYTHEPAIAVVRFLVAYSGEPEKHAELIETRTKTGYRALGAMERHLDGGSAYFVGAGLTLADLALYAYTHVAHEGGFDLAGYPAIAGVARPGRVRAGARHDRRMSVRVRFAPSPTGSLHLGNALAAVANRRFADEHGGSLVLRIDDTDPARVVAGGEEAILVDLDWLGIGWDEGPVRQSERGGGLRGRRQASRRPRAARRRDADGSLRLGETTLLARGRDGDLSAGERRGRPRARHHARHPRCRSQVERGAAAAHRARDRRGAPRGASSSACSSVTTARSSRSDTAACRSRISAERASRRRRFARTSRSSGIPTHDVRLDRGRIGRLAIDAITAMPDDELACRRRGAAPSWRGRYAGRAPSSRPGRWRARYSSPSRSSCPSRRDRRSSGSSSYAAPRRTMLDEAGAREIVRELKAVGGDLRALRLALTGAERGPGALDGRCRAPRP